MAARLPRKTKMEQNVRRDTAALLDCLYKDSSAHLGVMGMGLNNISLAVSFHADIFKEDPSAMGAFIMTNIRAISTLQSHMHDLITLGRFFDKAAAETGAKYNVVENSALGLGKRLSQTNRALTHLGMTNEVLPVLESQSRSRDPHGEMRSAHAVLLTQVGRMERYAKFEEAAARRLLGIFSDAAFTATVPEMVKYYLALVPDMTGGHKADLQNMKETLGAFRFGLQELK